jgi:prepilin-type N-terminal cleavage/methylation domain-containing protein
MKKDKSWNNSQGFSMMELLLVTVVLGIIAAIAIPNLMVARRTANEASAVASVRLVVRSEIVHRYANLDGDFATLSELHAQQHLDPNIGLSPHAKSGYLFVIELISASGSIPARFNVQANPAIHSLTNTISGTGSRNFGSNEAGAIYETQDNTPVTFDPIARTPQGTAVPLTPN